MTVEGVTTIVFDQDGTIYDAPAMGEAVLSSACDFVAERFDLDREGGRRMIDEARRRVREKRGVTPTLSLAVLELGLPLSDLHDHFARTVEPACHLTRDPRVVEMFDRLRRRYRLILYTNNNRVLTGKILEALGLTGVFGEIVTIEDSWRPKPDRETLEMIFHRHGVIPHETFFVGDREDIDITLPVSLGSRGVVVSTIDDLLAVGRSLLQGV
ncbi:MAG: HAD family hydrolase [Desulfuromonadia bacterium]